MVFAPFTGIDNHLRCVTFGAGLILKEDEESYTWLFKKFLEVVGRKPYYRLCMWHIMENVNVRVGHTLFKDNNFRNRLNSIVWDTNISPTQFETQWNDIMSDFGLTSHTWFINMYELRKKWIPAYFKDVPMSGLLKTTSRSESTNSWFGNFTNPGSNLVEFFMHFQSVIESQRHTTDKLDHTCQTAFPECKTRLAIEKHASSVYTHTVFLDDYSEIPRKLLAWQWMKSASITVHTKTGQIYQFAGGDEAALTLNNLWSDFHSCIGLAQGNIDKLSNLSRLVSEEKVKLLKYQPHTPSMGSKQSVMETYYGSTSHLDISLSPPKQAKNKGIGSNVRSRILSQREKAIKASTKLKRICGTCGEIETHNSRTCPKRNTTP
ncbi:hypothetical protein DH2020_003620 [Rehmannia glutinosa]|uniref:Protein FAR1-RELATED SEQUENCE n=1 Tax=Rehmannia glutinosa TaxID=99300 RepID=A0ABR0XMA2_REHGL